MVIPNKNINHQRKETSISGPIIATSTRVLLGPQKGSVLVEGKWDPGKFFQGSQRFFEILHLARSICSKVLDVKLGNDLKLQHYIAALELKSEVQTWRVGVEWDDKVVSVIIFFGGGRGWRLTSRTKQRRLLEDALNLWCKIIPASDVKLSHEVLI